MTKHSGTKHHNSKPFIMLIISVGQEFGKLKTALLCSVMSRASDRMILSGGNSKDWGLY